MVWASGWKLAAAVSNAGGLSYLALAACLDILQEHIQKCKATDKPFSVNVPLLYPDGKHFQNMVKKG